MFLVKRDYSNKNIIIKGFCTAILFSSFIYLSYFGIDYKIINSILGLTSIYLILTLPKQSLFHVGFFSGIFWFWWIGLSFEHYELSYLIPFVILAIGLLYGFFFYLFTVIDDNIYLRAAIFFAFTFIEPFGFNWFKPELIFVDSYFGITKLDFALILVAMILFKKHRSLFWIPLTVSFFMLSVHTTPVSDLKIYMPQLNVDQKIKWKKSNQVSIVKQNIDLIDKAITENYDLIILPETSFPLVLNQRSSLLDILNEKSNQIDIVLGSLYVKDDLYHNSTYHFSNEKVQVAHKVVLVPFGEAVPLPEKIRDLINDMFYNGAKDYTKADKPTDFNIKGINFRNGICYEATTDEIFENIGNTKYMIATSNNAWFTPSIEPVLQKLLMTYYSKKYNVVIYSSSNMSKNSVILPTI